MRNKADPMPTCLSSITDT